MKEVVRTESAPAPFQGAPYSQAIKANGFVFVAGQVGIEPDNPQPVGDGIRAQTEQTLMNLRAILEAAGSGMDKLVKTTVFLTDLDDFQGMNEVYARHVGDQPPARSTFQVGEASAGPARRDRGNRNRIIRGPDNRGLRARAAPRRVPRRWRGARRAARARVEGRGLRRAGVDYEACTPRSSRTGRLRSSRSRGDASARVSIRGTSELRRLAPAGIEFAPPRVERSTGPGRHDFEIVADPALSIEDDMGRRDFTVNAMATPTGDGGDGRSIRRSGGSEERRSSHGSAA